MKKSFTRFTALAAAAVMAFSASACDGKNNADSSASKVTEEQMPYGATIMMLEPETHPDVPITVDYDKRFLTEAEGTAVSQYVNALMTQDTATIEKLVYKPYLDFIMQQKGAADISAYLSAMYDNIYNIVGGTFKFTYIVINDCYEETDSAAVQNEFAQIESNISALDNGDFVSKAASRKKVAVELIYNLDSVEGEFSLTQRTGDDSYLYLYEVDGQIYVL